MKKKRMMKWLFCQRKFKILWGLVVLILITNFVTWNILSDDLVKTNPEIRKGQPIAGNPWQRFNKLDLKRMMQGCPTFSYEVNKCFEYLSTNMEDYLSGAPPSTCTDEQKLLFHIYWKGQLSDKVDLHLKSFLFTQNLKCSEAWVWVETPFQGNLEADPLVQLYKRYPQIKFKEWHLDLTKGTQFEGFQPIKSFNLLQKIVYIFQYLFGTYRYTVGFSDYFRFYVLYFYGGFYVDVDTLYLRDLWPFRDYEFAYRWGYDHTFNTAVIHLKKKGKAVTILSEEGMKNNNFHPDLITEYAKKHQLDFELLATPIFDPIWFPSDKPSHPASVEFTDILNPDLHVEEQFFLVDLGATPCHLRQFFKGAFAYHWHNQWKTPTVTGSYSWAFITYYNAFLEGKMLNLYGERFKDAEILIDPCLNSTSTSTHHFA